MESTLSWWMVFALGSAFFAGLTTIFAKMGVAGMNSDLATLVRTVVIFFVTIVIVSVRGEWQRPDEFLVRPAFFLVLSGVATGLSWLCYFRALEIGPASGVVSIDKLSVVFVVGLASFAFGERLTWRVCCGALLVAIGALLVSLPQE